jgi:hypothetical protein
MYERRSLKSNISLVLTICAVALFMVLNGGIVSKAVGAENHRTISVPTRQLKHFFVLTRKAALCRGLPQATK